MGLSSRLMALLMLVGAAGCWGRTDRPIIDVQFVQRQPEDVRVPEDPLKPAVRRMIDGWPHFSFRTAKPDEPGWQLTVRVDQLTDRPQSGRSGFRARSVVVSLVLRALGEVEGEMQTYSADRLVLKEEPENRPLTDLVIEGIEKTGQRLMRFRGIQTGRPQVVVAAIDDPDESVRLVAAQTAGQRKLEVAVPALIERLKDEEEAGAVTVAAVGALAQLQATEATDAIIATARRQDRRYLVPLLFALARLGGRQAEGYLFTVQSGHPDPVVRQTAEQALRELETRASSSSADPEAAP